MKLLLASASLALLLVASACAGGTGEKKNTDGEKTPITKVPPQEEDELSGDGKAWGGWRYTGKRDDCFFRVKRRCYDTKKQACEVAKCGKKKCRTEGAGPARVYCK